eukprot:TRINITY_DN9570_c0_g1_i1.p1 TRINITY_DN9570_c0_g1~~TRINITY_DN9570_c0_g1_i1.p1  ORF type:complete len:517 (-),score=74.42 TRINITY_DN9570_c0_g1_i1:126-1676(-)
MKYPIITNEKGDGCLFMWGHGNHGKLGMGNQKNISQPKLVSCLSGYYVVSVVCGNDHTIILDNVLKTKLYRATLGKLNPTQISELKDIIKKINTTQLNDVFNELSTTYEKHANCYTGLLSQFFSNKKISPALKLSKFCLDFGSVDGVPLNTVVKDNFTVLNKGRRPLSFKVPSLQATSFVLNIEPSSGTIGPKQEVTISLELSVLYMTSINEVIEVIVNEQYAWFIGMRVKTINQLSDLDIIDLKKVHKTKLIAGGASGKVYLGSYNDLIVAIKDLSARFAFEGDNLFYNFQRELSLLSSLKHPNIVNIIGACIEPPDLWIIMEYAERGSLYKVLQEETIVIPKAFVSGMAKGIATGMAFLHERKIIHRDLKSLNVLVTEDWVAKITDFGDSRSISNVMTIAKGTPQWMAPEVYHNANYTEKSDVYSYGIILWELVTRKIPYQGSLGSLRDILYMVQKGERPPIPPSCPYFWSKLMRVCWDTNPNTRPSFVQILEALENFQDVEPSKLDKVLEQPH